MVERHANPCILQVTSAPRLFRNVHARTQEILLNTRARACSELSLQILLWSASYVQKQSSYTDRKGSLTGPEKQCKVLIASAVVKLRQR